MKRILTVLLILAAFGVRAQEMVTPKAKKLQQLYLSFGTSPSFTLRNDSRTFGGGFSGNITGSFGPTYIFRFGVQHSLFTSAKHPAPQGVSPFFSVYNYETAYFPKNEVTSLCILAGKRMKLNKLVQLQAFAGPTANVTENWSEPDSEFGRCMPITTSFKPGLHLAAEAMFLPSSFAGLTAGTYFHLVPDNSNGGLSLNLNLGLLKRN